MILRTKEKTEVLVNSRKATSLSGTFFARFTPRIGQPLQDIDWWKTCDKAFHWFFEKRTIDSIDIKTTPNLFSTQLREAEDREQRLFVTFVKMKSVLSVLVLFLCFSVGYGLKCYVCVSTKSWSDCDDVRKEVTCPSIADRCLKGYADIKTGGASVEFFERSCSTEQLCSSTKNLDFCKGKGECKIDCCSGDLCNAAPLQIMSIIVLVACVLLALIQ